MSDLALPGYHVTHCQPDARPSGAVLIPARSADGAQSLVSVGRGGQITWCRPLPFPVDEVRLGLKEKTLLVIGQNGRAHEVSFDGRILQTWVSAGVFTRGVVGIRVNAQRLHHAIQEIAPDIYLAPSGADSDAVICFERKGGIRWQWQLDTRLGCSGGTASSAVMDPTDGGVLIALPNTGLVVKLSRRGDLVWVLQSGTEPTGLQPMRHLTLEEEVKVERPDHLSFCADGTLLLVDGRMARCLRIDADAMTARCVWAFQGAASHSGACEVPGGNRMIATSKPAELLEVAASGETVFHAKAPGWTFGRPEYLPETVAARLV